MCGASRGEVWRVGRDPRLRHTKTGVLIAKFPLAEHVSSPEGGEEVTNWHTVVAFKALAQKVSEEIKKGDAVKVVGYLSERVYAGKSRTEINAVVVKPETAPTPPEG
jgi:single-strand DNA-binding protein